MACRLPSGSGREPSWRFDFPSGTGRESSWRFGCRPVPDGGLGGVSTSIRKPVGAFLVFRLPSGTERESWWRSDFRPEPGSGLRGVPTSVRNRPGVLVAFRLPSRARQQSSWRFGGHPGSGGSLRETEPRTPSTGPGCSEAQSSPRGRSRGATLKHRLIQPLSAAAESCKLDAGSARYKGARGRVRRPARAAGHRRADMRP